MVAIRKLPLQLYLNQQVANQTTTSQGVLFNLYNS